MSERTTHDPATQAIKTRPSPIFYQPTSSGVEPMPVYYGHDFPTDELIGPFLTRGAVEWCLACISNVRDSQARRNGLFVGEEV